MPAASPSLQLLPASAYQLRTLLQAPERFEARFGIRPEPHFCGQADTLPFFIERLELGGEPPTWWLHLVILPEQAPLTPARLVGTAGFRGEPDLDGSVELGYEIAPHFRGQGLATEVTRQLLIKAFADARVRAVHAHTETFRGASATVLKRNGFASLGQVEHPTDGLLWGWRCVRSAHSEALPTEEGSSSH